VLARSYGFDSWPKLKAYVDGATVQRLAEAVHHGDLEQVRALLKARPELANMDMAGNNEHRALHYAVLDRLPELVRVLMQHGADARKGIYPHRDATNALTLATERGYDEIVAVIQEEEQHRQEMASGPNAPTTFASDELAKTITRGDEAKALALLEANPALASACDHDGSTPLHTAAAVCNQRLLTWLLDHGADVNRRDPNGRTPLDLAAARRWGKAPSAEQFTAVARLLRQRGAELTARSGVALGEADWLRASHAQGMLVNPIEQWGGGLLTVAVWHDRQDMLTLLLDFGFDPDERTRVDSLEEVILSFGMPLWNCAVRGKHDMAEMLLKRGADPNALVYASGSPVFQAYGQQDWAMVKLLERYGGVASATTAGLYRQTELAKQILAGQVDGGLDEGTFGGKTLAEQLLWSAACGGDPEIVRLALAQIDWRRDDARWYPMLEQPLRIWNHGTVFWAHNDWDRSTYLACFRLMLERCDANVPGRFGLTILHDVSASREHVTAEERLAFATMLLDAGARVDTRDHLLKSTPLGWACRWGRTELVKLLLDRGANPVEADAEPWAAPMAWADKMRHDAVIALLRERAG